MSALPTAPCRATGGTATERPGALDPPPQQLVPLLHAAATTGLDDPAWHELTVTARAVTVALAGAGRLPCHLVVGPHDPPVLVARQLAGAWRHVTDAPRVRRP